MLAESARGVFTIAVTPFLPDGALDNASLATMTEFYLRHDATGLTLLGIMGEAPKLPRDESLTVVRRVAKAVAVPIVVGATAPGFAAMRDLAEGAVAAGAAGVMVAPAPAKSQGYSCRASHCGSRRATSSARQRRVPSVMTAALAAALP